MWLLKSQIQSGNQKPITKSQKSNFCPKANKVFKNQQLKFEQKIVIFEPIKNHQNE